MDDSTRRTSGNVGAELTSEQLKAQQDAMRRTLGKSKTKQRGAYNASVDASGIHVRNKLKKMRKHLKAAPGDMSTRECYVKLGGKESDLPPVPA